MAPHLTPHPLHRAHGSTLLTTPLTTILASINGPLEPSRRDELPSTTYLEISLRPASGVPSPREKWLESIVGGVLRSVILGQMLPRTMVQIVLQVVSEGKMRRQLRDVAVLPALVNAAFAALVDCGLPLGRTVVAGLAVVRGSGEVVVDPSTVEDLRGCRSVHAMGFDGRGEVVMEVSEGVFGVEVWEEVGGRLRAWCLSAIERKEGDEAMGDGEVEDEGWLRKALEENVRRGTAWRESG